MQPASYPLDLDDLRRVWHTFVQTRRLPPEDQARVDPVVWRSWQRCVPRLDPYKTPTVTPLAESAFQVVRLRNTPLITVARPVIEDLHQFMEGSFCAVLLTDGAGCILDLVGDAEMLPMLHAQGWQRGVYWSEGRLGTNAVALALREAMPVQVVGPEHYLAALHDLAVAAAPIHDVSGRILGVLGIITRLPNAHPHTLAAVMAAARAITNQMQTDHYLQEANARYSELHNVFETISEGVLAWNASGVITHINARAGAILGVSPTGVVGRPLHTVVRFAPAVQQAIESHTPLEDLTTTLTVQDRTVSCVISLRPMREGVRLRGGFIMTLRPMGQVRALVHRLVGAQAMLTLDAAVLGDAPPMRRLRRQARRVAQGWAPVLIRGEDGVGKNPLARAIHNAGPRAQGPFIAVNCQTIPHELMPAEFLGYAPGAYQGLPQDGRPSKFELADGGTLFLDRIEALSLEVQAALLEVLEMGHVLRLGGSRPIPVDVRIIASTSADLERLVEEGSFRADLYRRFRVFTLWVPPLRERPGDIPLLAQRVLERLERQLGHPLRLADGVMDLLQAYPWPGNLRELEHVLERAALFAEDGVIRPEHLPAAVRQGRRWVVQAGDVKPVLTLAEAEKEAILRAAQACRGRVKCMAEVLGISRTTLWRRLKALGVDLDAFRASARAAGPRGDVPK